MKCNNCGATIDRAATFCGYCGTSVSSQSATAPAMSVAMPAMAAAPATFAPQMQGSASSDSDMKPYYREEFARFDANPAARPIFNWAAFWFNILWYLSQGIWGKAFVLFCLSLITGGAAGIFVAVYAGFRGNADLWLLRRQGKQFWW